MSPCHDECPASEVAAVTFRARCELWQRARGHAHTMPDKPSRSLGITLALHSYPAGTTRPILPQHLTEAQLPPTSDCHSPTWPTSPPHHASVLAMHAQRARRPAERTQHCVSLATITGPCPHHAGQPASLAGQHKGATQTCRLAGTTRPRLLTGRVTHQYYQ